MKLVISSSSECLFLYVCGVCEDLVVVVFFLDSLPPFVSLFSLVCLVLSLLLYSCCIFPSSLCFSMPCQSVVSLFPPRFVHTLFCLRCPSLFTLFFLSTDFASC
ncbi:hypothetical protein K435DRAFT_72202 [Dendrothele bispora CBS 962.96]|uniref:Uncharacterized protein n=1 Tax=Dendrothele bispora (strain CBS 962.96) TaxID=1314807 RepID=A0A4S8KQI7_DENBC|nr:hypothetical protein K435DRAFT_72202 [Dendrothele bispora CBS 962.96]